MESARSENDKISPSNLVERGCLGADLKAAEARISIDERGSMECVESVYMLNAKASLKASLRTRARVSTIDHTIPFLDARLQMSLGQVKFGGGPKKASVAKPTL